MTVPDFSGLTVVIASVASTVSENVDEAVFCAESVTVMITLNVPAVVGVPAMAPAVERLRPAGSEDPPPAAHVHV